MHRLQTSFENACKQVKERSGLGHPHRSIILCAGQVHYGQSVFDEGPVGHLYIGVVSLD